MDNTTINTEFIQNLRANRGAVGSAVTVKRTIGNMMIGGDVVNSFIQSGYDQELSAVASNPATSLGGQTIPAGGAFNGQAPPTIQNRILNTLQNQPTFSPLAHGGGAIHGKIAGNVTNSIISTSVDPDPSGLTIPGQFQRKTSQTFAFGAPDNIILPRGTINVKVEGTINNSGLQSGTAPFVDPSIPANSAFFASNTKIDNGPVVPPNVPQAPYTPPVIYHKGQRFLKGLFKRDNSVHHPKKG
jgi:hypothetical protein